MKTWTYSRYWTASAWTNFRSGQTRSRTTRLSPRLVRIFLASSAELREDRDAFDLYFRQQNDQLHKKG